MGSLYEAFPVSLLRSIGLTPKSKVADFIKNSGWNWPQELLSFAKEFKAATPPALMQHFHRQDCVAWLGSSSGDFSVKSAKKQVGNSGNIVEWFKLVWGKGHIPKFAFIFWLAIQGKLMAKDRLCRWGVANVSLFCVFWVLCGHEN